MILESKEINNILTFWFGKNVSYDKSEEIDKRVKGLWFSEDEKVDENISKKFKVLLRAVSKKSLNKVENLDEKMALIILFDQFPRNIFRNKAESFSYDHIALRLARSIIDMNEDINLEPIKRFFLYLPFEHSENKEDQEISIRKFKRLYQNVDSNIQEHFKVFLDYAVKHKVVIDRFGRFPHRNEILGRKSTEKEKEFLKEPDSSF